MDLGIKIIGARATVSNKVQLAFRLPPIGRLFLIVNKCDLATPSSPALIHTNLDFLTRLNSNNIQAAISRRFNSDPTLSYCNLRKLVGRPRNGF